MAAVRIAWPTVLPHGSWRVGGLIVVAMATLLGFYPIGPRSAAAWFRLLALSVLLAAMFWAANQALDLIKPPGSRRHDAAATVAGFELWALLCPGLSIVAAAGWARALILRSHRA